MPKTKQKMIPYENYEMLCQLNRVSEQKLYQLKKENEELKKKLDLFKNLEFLKILFK